MNNSKKARIRQERIRDMLLGKDFIGLHEFCSELQASEATIRNDLSYLEKQHMLKRVLGGAISTEGTPRNTNYHLRSSLYIDDKAQIANYAVTHFIKPEMTITLDAGTTCRYIAQELVNRKIPCNVITNSLAAAHVLEKSDVIQLYLIGGKYDKEHASFYDHTTIDVIADIYSDIYFLSPNGIDIKGQITSSASNEHAVKQAFIKQAKDIIIVADHSKFEKTAMKVLCSFDQITCILSDSHISKALTQDFKSIHVKLISTN